jgi:hypothetical protein
MNLETTRIHALTFLVSLVFGVACAGMPGGLDLSGLMGSSSHTERHESSHREESVRVNGHEIDEDEWEDEEDEDEERRSKKKKRRRGGRRGQTVADNDIDDIGTTCKKNSECDARACWVGSGNLGYCTKMCNSWSDCPSHWDCKKPGNAPQKICMQDS